MTGWTVLAPDEWTAEHDGAVAYIRRRTRYHWQVVRDAAVVAHGESKTLTAARFAARAALTGERIDSRRGWESIGGESVRYYRRALPTVRATVVKRGPGAYRWELREGNEIVGSGYVTHPHLGRRASDRLGLACVARIEGRAYRIGVAA